MRRVVSGAWTGLLLTAGLLVRAQAAVAQGRVSVQAELTGGALVPGGPAGRADLGPALDAHGRVGLRVAGPLWLQVAGGYRRLLSPSQGDVSLGLLAAGGRVDVPAGARGVAFAEAHAGAALSPDLTGARFAFDAAAGFELHLAAGLRVGPVLRYAQVVALADGDARSLTGGVSLRFGGGGPALGRPAPPDADGDGVLDPDDRCPAIPRGPSPDPAHPGCPASAVDTDGDGVEDALDRCVTEPEVYNDLADDDGCPDGVADADHDMVPDPDDRCPYNPGPPEVGGCPSSLVVIEDTTTALRVAFADGSDALRPESSARLRTLADELRAQPARAVELRLEVAPRPSPAATLARRRAARVVGALLGAAAPPASVRLVAASTAAPTAADHVAVALAAPPAARARPRPPPARPAPTRPPLRPVPCVAIVTRGDPLREAFADGGFRDADRDGVADEADRCPREPSGARPNTRCLGCPLRDLDGDGVFADADRCPEEPAGAHPDPTAAGCPDRDVDGDGVFDHGDVCPLDARGPRPDPTRAGCPDGDADDDGLVDHDDRCPAHAAGPRPDPARAGCPAPDRDRDGVPDASDRCADAAGAPAADAARNGCPGALVYDAATGRARFTRPVSFAAGSESARTTPALDALGDALRALGLRRPRVEMTLPGPDPALAARRLAWIAERLAARGAPELRVQARAVAPGAEVAEATITEEAP